ncbi:MAG: anti-sigma factor domain-containing protein, partial [Actinomycetota bacterium]
MSEHPAMEELIAAYALGSIDPAGHSAAEGEILDHITGCTSCRAVYAEMRDTAAELALGAHADAAPPALEQRILGTIRGEAPVAPARGARTISMRLGTVAAAVMLVLVGGLAAFAASIAGRLDRSEDRSAMMIRAFSVVGRPGAGHMMLSGPKQGSLMLAYRGEDAVLVGSEVPMPEPGMVFQLWFVKGITSMPAGVFRPDDGVVVLPVSMDPTKFDRIAVTLE